MKVRDVETFISGLHGTEDGEERGNRAFTANNIPKMIEEYWIERFIRLGFFQVINVSAIAVVRFVWESIPRNTQAPVLQQCSE